MDSFVFPRRVMDVFFDIFEERTASIFGVTESGSSGCWY
jgi:hypothetical protein